jgi:sialate O-acetylesterase
MKLTLIGDDNIEPKSISLAGDWSYRTSTPLGQLSSPPEMDSNNPNKVTVLYNGMIAPLKPFPIKGAIWYQGESNSGRPAQYRTLLPTMIKDWRASFEVGDFPFYIVQLANFMQVRKEPLDSQWAELRESQFLATKALPNVGIGLAIDIGDAKDIHPRNKQEVGRRLALSALANAFGKDIEFSGPVFKSKEVKGNTIRLSFDHVGGGLVAKGSGKLEGFAIAGEDGKYVWADATIDGDTIVVSSSKVENPINVRYAWADNPICNLYNQVGLPAVPFRTNAPQ